MRLVIALLIAVSAALAADAKLDWIASTGITVRTIDPADNGFEDLMPLKKVIGSARIVQLGEQTHGDGATFQAKQRLIRFLHEQMGFNVLAWESGYLDCEQMNDALKTDMPAGDVMAGGIFPIWSRGELITPLFDYARTTLKTPHPLRMTGFDIQMSGDWEPSLQRYVNLLPKERQPEWKEFLTALWQPKYKPGEQREKWKALIASLPGDEKVRENLTNLEEMRFHDGMGNRIEAGNLRDAKMAGNLAWLATTKYPKEKIIVWAASMHIARNPAQIETGNKEIDYRDYPTMGHILSGMPKLKTYSIAFTAFEGVWGTGMRVKRLPTAAPDSFEAIAHSTGKPYLFVDLHSATKQKFVAGPLGYAPMTSVWADNFGAFFFTDKMFANPPRGTKP